MGNSCANKSVHDEHAHNTAAQDLKSLIQTRRQRKDTKFFNEFFHHIHRKYCLSHQVTADSTSCNCNRIVFISIYGLYRTWKECPPISLYDAIFILPLKREWIRSPRKHTQQYSDLLRDEQFLTLLRWKAHQNLALFLIDDYSSTPRLDCDEFEQKDDVSTLVAPAWKALSCRLQQLSDPSKPHNVKYNALHLSAAYWKHDSSVCNHVRCDINRRNAYKLTASKILVELYLLSMKFDSMRTILLESNPSLNVVTHYSAPRPNSHQSEAVEEASVPFEMSACRSSSPSHIASSRSPSETVSPSYSSATVCYEDMYANMAGNLQVDDHKASVVCSLSDDWWIADNYEDEHDNHSEIAEFENEIMHETD